MPEGVIRSPRRHKFARAHSGNPALRPSINSFKCDCLPGPNNSYIATLVERHTRYVMLAKVAGKDTQTVVSALIKQAKKLPTELYKSLTWDRGKELTDRRKCKDQG